MKGKRYAWRQSLCVLIASLSLIVSVMGLSEKVAAEGNEATTISVTTAAEEASPALEKNVQQAKEETQKAEDKKILAEALKAYEETLKAVDYLDEGKKDEALQALERAVGKLDILIGRYPEVAYLPVDIQVETLTFVGDVESIRRQRDEVEFLVKKGYLQAARHILQYLASEIHIVTVNLPMETYPTAIRGVARLIEEGKLEEAKRALTVTLSTLVTIERSIPIPVLNSQWLIAEAAKIVSQKAPAALSAEEKQKILDYLAAAHEQLEIAEELGYGRRDWEFAQLHDDIREIENKVQSGQKSGGLLEKLQERLQKFKERITQ